MLHYETARKLYEKINEKALGNSTDEILTLYQNFLESACDYSKARVKHAIHEQLFSEEDIVCSGPYDEYESKLDAICKELGIEIEYIIPNRRTKEDFAHYIVQFLFRDAITRISSNSKSDF